MIRRQVAVGSALLAASGDAFAHTSIEGVGSFVNGLLHPAVVPAHAILVVALGLLLGQQGSEHLQRALPAFAGVLAVALIGSGQAPLLPFEAIQLVMGLLLGLLLASARALPGRATLLLAPVAAAAIGLDSNPEGQAGTQRLTTLAGTWMGASFAVLWFFGIADALRRDWQKIAVRVAGSWIAAAAVMVLALGAAP